MPRRPKPLVPPDPNAVVVYEVKGRFLLTPSGLGTMREVSRHQDAPDALLRPIDERPELLVALADLRVHRAGVLLVPAREALGADPVDVATVEACARMNQASVVFETTPATTTELALVAAMLRCERMIRAMLIRVGLETRRIGGKSPYGEPPYGFRREGPHLVPDPHEQSAIHHILHLRSLGRTYAEINTALLDAGWHPRRGGPWRSHTLAAILGRANGQTGSTP